jgi:hypothetical protein
MLNLGEPGDLDITLRADRVLLTDANTPAKDLALVDAISAPTAVSIRRDGSVAWEGRGRARTC